MSPDGVHEDEMPHLPEDQWPAGDPALASFAEDLRIIAGGPAPEPRPGLVAVMRQGPTVPNPTPTGRKHMLVKTFLGSLVAKVAMGVGVATASVTAAGAAGVLPEPAQDAVASVVAAATPFELPDPSDTLKVAKDTVSSTSTSLPGDDDGEASGDDDATTGDGERKVNHGACVSTAAKDKTEPASGSNHGKTVSSVARSDCGKTSTSTSTTVVSSTTSTTTVSPSTSTSIDAASRSGNPGRGNGGNSGGNSGNSGNSGNGGGNSGRN